MPEVYYCLNCEAVMNLDKHLRCSVCGSDSVDLAVRPAATIHGIATAFLTTEELEGLYERS
jgi:Zn finger protein HypA/HybF involved in hydrogenase expression